MQNCRYRGVFNRYLTPMSALGIEKANNATANECGEDFIADFTQRYLFLVRFLTAEKFVFIRKQDDFGFSSNQSHQICFL